jgi:hypothetical protein
MDIRIAALGVIASLTFASQANSAVVTFGFSNGAGVSGSGTFTTTLNVSPTDPNPLCGMVGQNACRADPPGAYSITSISGTFSDTADGINNAAITGLIPISPANERDAVFDPLVPTSLSFYDLTPSSNGAFTYNNLFFPAGSPIDCAFPFSGTFLDVFGLAFNVAGGYAVDLWGDGDLHGPGTLTYGVRVTDGTRFLVDQFDGVNATATIPEPATWMIMLMGFGALGYALRRRRVALQA